jgi:protein-tyrosine-phosphatase
MTQGYLTIGGQPVSGFDILPATILGTIITMPLLIAGLGGFHFSSARRILGRDVPFPKLDTLISGIAFAIIIATTTMAYTFAGISIVLALVLMRGSVLAIAPISDAIAGRPVHTYSWMALALSMTAVAVAVSQVGSYVLTVAAVVNLAVYLSGYVVRLNLMTQFAKVADEAVNRRFIAEECIVAVVTLIVISIVIAFMGGCSEALTPQCALNPFITNPMAGAALLTGIAYGIFGVFATLIYLNPLENTFSVPVNRCSSLLSGVVASLALTSLYGAPSLKTADLISIGLIMLAGFVLYVRTMPRSTWQEGADAVPRARRFLLFVCSGNTSRSPLAQAICNAEIVRRLARCPRRTNRQEIEVASAGLSAKPGAPITEEAQQTLARLGIPAPPHASRNLTPELIESATAIICMTSQQCNAILAIYPASSGKIHRLHPFRDLDDPTGRGAKAFLSLSRQIQQLINQRLSYFLLESGSRA